MSIRIVFVVMSAVHRADSIDQLARALQPHRVLVHHDFSQTPDFALRAPNASFVPDPVRTGWGEWGFTKAVFHSLRHALEHQQFDYLQVLSPSCLPIKPMSAFEAHLESSGQDAHFGGVNVFANRDALMSAGHRAFAPTGSLRYRALFKLSRAYYGPSPRTLDTDGIQLHVGHAVNARGAMTLRARTAWGVTEAFKRGAIGRHPFTVESPLLFGATWVGARREVVAGMVRLFDDRTFTACFERMFSADEFILPTMLHRLSERPGPMNHLVNTFELARPRWLEEADLGRLRACPAFFARKFVDDPAAPSRVRALAELAGVDRQVLVGA
jgi:hypothetical protein